MFGSSNASHGRAGHHGSSLVFFSCVCLVILCFQIGFATAVSRSRLSSLQKDTNYLFYHGYDNYMKYAFPEDELRPVTCGAFTRDFENQNHWELNDPLGDYSLTLIDTLSSLAVLASSSLSHVERRKSLKHFHEGVETVVKLYGDGSNGTSAEGERARGFDIDSKVQVFETAIRGLGGLLSAHLFAIGELPIREYHPEKLARKKTINGDGIRWTRDFTYDGQLLRLAHDLGLRLLPAFSTQTGIPYPRVNLRHGIPFYKNAPQNCGADAMGAQGDSNGQCFAVPHADEERTETCSAGAGSLVLEFSTLSRLTGDGRFEKLAKRAFWAVWYRRMPTGLVGSGIDAETGEWKGAPSTGIGAGVDSFYEYAIKSYVLLSGTTPFPSSPANNSINSLYEPPPLTPAEEQAESFLAAWQASQQSIRRHVYRGENSVHPHYSQVNLFNAAHQASWIDSLSAFYPGSLVIAGEIEEAAVTHLLYTALWARYSALPERWSSSTGDIEHGLPWWPGRPEFIESAWYLYRATEDPWYIHVGEMTLRDIKRRCWTPCGWAGLQDVRTGELTDRMESFFLGETVKYLHLLFDPEHPLNKLDAPWVFTTEGHPLIIPRGKAESQSGQTSPTSSTNEEPNTPVCPVAPPPLPLTISRTAARPDLFHAAALARLHWATPDTRLDSALFEATEDHPGVSLEDVRSPTNYSFFPWTLPKEYVPPSGTCAPIYEIPTLHITFPTPTALAIQQSNHRTIKGIIMNNLAGVRLSMIQDLGISGDSDDSFRINAVNNQPIGRDEQLFLGRDTLSSMVNENDPNFARIRDSVNLQLVFDIATSAPAPTPPSLLPNKSIIQSAADAIIDKLIAIGPDDQDVLLEALSDQLGKSEGTLASAIRYIADKVSMKLSSRPQPGAQNATFRRFFVGGIMASGLGAAPLPDVADALPLDINSGQPSGDLVWNSVYAAGRLCDDLLPQEIAQHHQILLVRRGGCSFSTKLQNIPSYVPGRTALQLVVLVNDIELDHDGGQSNGGGGDGGSGVTGVYDPDNEPMSFRPVLDQQQRTPKGLLRRHPIPLIMVEGGEEVYEMLSTAKALGIRRRYTVQAQGVPIRNVHIL